MNIQRLSAWVLAAVLFALTGGYSIRSAAQAPGSAPTGLLNFEVKDGNCSPTSASVNAGRIMFVVKMSSSSPQSVALFTAGTDRKSFFQHQQVGSSERWSTMISLPAGNYELISSLNGTKCTVTVN